MTSVMTQDNIETLSDFADIVSIMEDARKKCFDNNSHDLGHKISGIIQSFKAFSEDEIIKLAELLD